MKSRVIFLVLFFMALTVNAKNVSTHTVNREDGSSIVYYLLHKTHETPSDTLLLVLQGSDCNSVLKIDSIFTDFKNAWPEADILLVEKYGIDNGLHFSAAVEREDCPSQYLRNDSPEQRVADIKTVLDIVRKDNKYPNLIVLGGSEGGVIGNLAASRINDITATVSFNGGGRWFIDDVIHNITNSSENSDEIEKGINEFRGLSKHILNSKPYEIEISGHGYKWWYHMLSIDQLEVLSKVSTPILLIQGDRDLSVSPQKVDEMISALRRSGKDNITYIKYEGLDHRLSDTQGESKRKEVVHDISIWLESILGSSNKSTQLPANASAD